MHKIIMLVAAVLLAIQSGVAQGGAPPTNIRAYQLLSARIGDSLNANIATQESIRVLLSVKPEGSAWLVEGGIAQALQRQGRIVVVAQPADYEAALGVIEMHVVYENARSEGVFTGKLVDRDLVLNMSAKVVDQRTGVLVLSKELHETMVDTVRESEIPTLEDPNVPLTQGTLPGEGFFSSLVEPLIMLSAVAVAVYLLFTVRS
jgi:hypothetical protein